MKKIILIFALLGSGSVWAEGKASVLQFQDASQIPHVWGCRLRYGDSAMTVGQALQLMETNPSLTKSLKTYLEIKSARVDDLLIEKAVAYQKEKKWMIGECSKAKLDDLFADVKNMQDCAKLEKLVDEMNKVPIARENFNFSDRCNNGTKATIKPVPAPSAR